MMEGARTHAHTQRGKNTWILYRVSQEEWTILRESVPYVKIYRYNQKHLCPKLNGYGDKGQKKSVVFLRFHVLYLVRVT